MVHVDEIEIDDDILDKIERKHGVDFDEVLDVSLSATRQLLRGRERLYDMFGTTASGRYLLIVVRRLGQGRWRVVTARDMTVGERRKFQQRAR